MHPEIIHNTPLTPSCLIRSGVENLVGDFSRKTTGCGISSCKHDYYFFFCLALNIFIFKEKNTTDSVLGEQPGRSLNPRLFVPHVTATRGWGTAHNSCWYPFAMCQGDRQNIPSRINIPTATAPLAHSAGPRLEVAQKSQLPITSRTGMLLSQQPHQLPTGAAPCLAAATGGPEQSQLCPSSGQLHVLVFYDHRIV